MRLTSSARQKEAQSQADETRQADMSVPPGMTLVPTAQLNRILLKLEQAEAALSALSRKSGPDHEP